MRIISKQGKNAISYEVAEGAEGWRRTNRVDDKNTSHDD